MLVRKSFNPNSLPPSEPEARSLCVPQNFCGDSDTQALDPSRSDKRNMVSVASSVLGGAEDDTCKEPFLLIVY